jgi:hypothetical protein
MYFGKYIIIFNIFEFQTNLEKIILPFLFNIKLLSINFYKKYLLINKIVNYHLTIFRKFHIQTPYKNEFTKNNL